MIRTAYKVKNLMSDDVVIKIFLALNKEKANGDRI